MICIFRIFATLKVVAISFVSFVVVKGDMLTKDSGNGPKLILLILQ